MATLIHLSVCESPSNQTNRAIKRTVQTTQHETGRPQAPSASKQRIAISTGRKQPHFPPTPHHRSTGGARSPMPEKSVSLILCGDLRIPAVSGRRPSRRFHANATCTGSAGSFSVSAGTTSCVSPTISGIRGIVLTPSSELTATRKTSNTLGTRYIRHVSRRGKRISAKSPPTPTAPSSPRQLDSPNAAALVDIRAYKPVNVLARVVWNTRQ